jgi:pimeloyl-ACP methyl ester carboxylesterase
MRHASSLAALATCIWFLGLTSLHAANISSHSVDVAVDGHQMFLKIAGHGEPVIVLEAGSASDSDSWRSVQPRLAAVSTVISYDRAGLGRSQPGAPPRTAKQIAADLDAVLRGTGLRPPYVLVTHSLGALYSREFAYLYPTEVAGMVLVEPAPPAFYGWFQHRSPDAWKDLMADAVKSSTGAKQELDSLNASIDEVQRAWPLPRVPTYILVATRRQPPLKDAEGLRVWVGMQKRLCQRLADCVLVEDSHSGHNMPTDDPKLIVKSVKKVLARINRGK